MSIPLQQAIRHIDEAGHEPFKITFYKSDGKIRDMIATKRNNMRIKGSKQAAPGSAFKYSLKQKNVLLINELIGFPTHEVQTSIGTHQQIPAIDLAAIRPDSHRMAPKSVKLFALKSFNGQEIIHE